MISGLLTVSDIAAQEPYLYPLDRPSNLTFDVKDAARRLEVMGDHGSGSSDSCAHLGDPGGGMVRLDEVMGGAATIYRPPSRAGLRGAPCPLQGLPAGTTGARHR
jgi:signal peptidase I